MMEQFPREVMKASSIDSIKTRLEKESENMFWENIPGKSHSLTIHVFRASDLCGHIFNWVKIKSTQSTF